MKILLFGASSYIGARIYQDLFTKYEIIGTYNSHPIFPELIKLNLNNQLELDKLVTENKPDIIIHTANYSSSRGIEGNEEKYQELNYEVTNSIVNIANKINAKLIFLSSMAAVTKSNLYGELKFKSEEIVKQVNAGYFILRPSAVIGTSPNHSNNKITDKISMCLKGDIQSFDTSWRLQPTYIEHISQVIDQIITNNYWRETLNLYLNYPVTQFEIAKDILSQFNIEPHEIDLGINIPLMRDNSHEIKKYTLTPNSYSEVIKIIVKDLSKQFDGLPRHQAGSNH